MRDILTLIGVLPIYRADKTEVVKPASVFRAQKYLTFQSDEDRLRNKIDTDNLFKLLNIK